MILLVVCIIIYSILVILLVIVPIELMDEFVNARNSSDTNCDSESNDSAGMSRPDKHRDFKLLQFSVVVLIVMVVIIMLIIVVIVILPITTSK